LPGKSGLTSAIHQGFAVSLLLHSALALPFVLREPPPSPVPEEAATLVVEFEGVISDSQSEEIAARETKADQDRKDVETEEAALPPVEEARPERVSPDPPVSAPEISPAPAEPVAGPPVEEWPREITAEQQSAPAEPIKSPAESEQQAPVTRVTAADQGDNDIAGAEEQQTARTIKADREAETGRLREYARQLTKKIQSHLVYPREARQAGLTGTAKVTFTILTGGQILPGTLRVTVSSGQARLDESALQTVRVSAPFDPPPQQMTVAVAVAFGRGH